jgi:hypothetical protein
MPPRCAPLRVLGLVRPAAQAFVAPRDGQSFDAYVAEMRLPTTWGGHVELAVAADVLQRNIDVYSVPAGGARAPAKIRIVPSTPERCAVADAPGTPLISLGHIAELHYIPLVPVGMEQQLPSSAAAAAPVTPKRKRSRGSNIPRESPKSSNGAEEAEMAPASLLQLCKSLKKKMMDKLSKAYAEELANRKDDPQVPSSRRRRCHGQRRPTS